MSMRDNMLAYVHDKIAKIKLILSASKITAIPVVSKHAKHSTENCARFQLQFAMIERRCIFGIKTATYQ